MQDCGIIADLTYRNLQQCTQLETNRLLLLQLHSHCQTLVCNLIPLLVVW